MDADDPAIRVVEVEPPRFDIETEKPLGDLGKTSLDLLVLQHSLLCQLPKALVGLCS